MIKECGSKVKSKPYKKYKPKTYEDDVLVIRKTPLSISEIRENVFEEEKLQNTKEDKINDENDQALKDILEKFYLYLETITDRIQNHGIKSKGIQEV